MCSLTSDPWGIGYPAAVNSVRACAGRLGAQIWDGRPENTCHPGFVEHCHQYLFCREKDERATAAVRIRVRMYV